MALEQGFLLYALGPRCDLSVGYLNAVINGATVTVSSATTNPGEVSPGFNLVRSTNGVYTVTFPKCKYCKIIPVFSPTAAANGMIPRVIAGFDPTAGTATLELATTATGAAADPGAAANELELIFLLGF